MRPIGGRRIAQAAHDVEVIVSARGGHQTDAVGDLEAGQPLADGVAAGLQVGRVDGDRHRRRRDLGEADAQVVEADHLVAAAIHQPAERGGARAHVVDDGVASLEHVIGIEHHQRTLHDVHRKVVGGRGYVLGVVADRAGGGVEGQVTGLDQGGTREPLVAGCRHAAVGAGNDVAAERPHDGLADRVHDGAVEHDVGRIGGAEVLDRHLGRDHGAPQVEGKADRTAAQVDEGRGRAAHVDVVDLQFARRVVGDAHAAIDVGEGEQRLEVGGGVGRVVDDRTSGDEHHLAAAATADVVNDGLAGLAHVHIHTDGLDQVAVLVDQHLRTGAGGNLHVRVPADAAGLAGDVRDAHVVGLGQQGEVVVCLGRVAQVGVGVGVDGGRHVGTRQQHGAGELERLAVRRDAGDRGDLRNAEAIDHDALANDVAFLRPVARSAAHRGGHAVLYEAEPGVAGVIELAQARVLVRARRSLDARAILGLHQVVEGGAVAAIPDRDRDEANRHRVGILVGAGIAMEGADVHAAGALHAHAVVDEGPHRGVGVDVGMGDRHRDEATRQRMTVGVSRQMRNLSVELDRISLDAGTRAETGHGALGRVAGVAAGIAVDPGVGARVGARTEATTVGGRIHVGVHRRIGADRHLAGGPQRYAVVGEVGVAGVGDIDPRFHVGRRDRTAAVVADVAVAAAHRMGRHIDVATRVDQRRGDPGLGVVGDVELGGRHRHGEQEAHRAAFGAHRGQAVARWRVEGAQRGAARAEKQVVTARRSVQVDAQLVLAAAGRELDAGLAEGVGAGAAGVTHIEGGRTRGRGGKLELAAVAVDDVVGDAVLQCAKALARQRVVDRLAGVGFVR